MGLEQCEECKFKTTPLTAGDREYPYPNEKDRQLLFPKDTDLSVMMNVEYWLDVDDKCIHSCMNRNLKEWKKNKKHLINNEKCEYLLKNGWRLLATFKIKSEWLPILQQHCASAFYNIKSKQLVIVHRGSDGPLCWASANVCEVLFKDFASSFVGVIMDKFVGKPKFSEMAYIFTRQVIHFYGSAARSITVTGHSLGGWLAQACTFRSKYQKLFKNVDQNMAQSYKDKIKWKIDLQTDNALENYQQTNSDPKLTHLHCVCFDSPGFQCTLETKIPQWNVLGDDRLISFRYLDSLDVTVYLAESSIVGKIHKQIGSVFQMKGIKTHNSDKMSDFFMVSSHNENIFVIEDQGIFFPKEQQTLKRRNMSKFRMSVFNEIERNFCTVLDYCRQNIPENDQKDYFGNLRDDIQPKNFKVLQNQVIYLTGKSDSLEARDSFIEQLKLESCTERNLPKFVNWCRKAYCQEYRALLPEINKSNLEVLNLKRNTDPLIVLAVEQEKTRSCATQVYHLWKSEVEPAHYFFLHTEMLEKLNRVHPGFSEDIAKLEELKLIVIECLQDFNQEILLEFLCKLLKVEKRKVILIISEANLQDLRSKQQNKQKLSILDKTQEQIIESKLLQTTFNSLSENTQQQIKEKVINFCGKERKLGDLIFDKNEDIRDGFADLDLSFAFYVDKESSIGNPIPRLTEFENAYFIERKFNKMICKVKVGELCKVNVEDLKEKTAKCTDKIFISCAKEWRANFIGKFVLDTEQVYIWSEENLSQYNLERFIFIDEVKEQSPPFEELKSFAKEKSISGHWLNFDKQIWEENNMLIWLESFGTPSMEYLDLQTAKKMPKECETFQVRDFLNKTKSQLTIISDDPGKGKSIIMKKLASVAAEFIPPSWIIYLDLQHCKQAVNELKKQISYDDALNFLVTFECKGTCQLILPILEAFLNTSGRVYIFFDGFDEIPHELQENVQELIKCLLDNFNTRIFLASRVHMQSELMKYFNRFCYTFRDFNNIEKIEFLKKFWPSHTAFTKDPQLMSDGTTEARRDDIVKKYASDLIVVFEKEIGQAARELIGTPLYMYMLAIIAMEKHFIPYYKAAVGITDENLNQEFPGFSNRVSFYQKFIDEKFRIAMEEKWRLGPNEPEFPRKAAKRRLRKKHGSCAFEFLFGINTAEKFFNFKSVEKEFDLNGLIDAGIVVVAEPKQNVASYHSAHYSMQKSNLGQDRFLFIHRTLAEYFAADFIVTKWTKNKKRFKDPTDFKDQVKEMKTFLDDQLFLKKNRQFRYFLNELILQHKSTPTAFRNIKNPNEVLIYVNELNKGTEKHELDCFNRTILHCIFAKVLDGELNLSQYGDAFVNGGIMLNQKDIFDATPFAYLQPTKEMHRAISLLRDIGPPSKAEHLILGTILGELNISTGEQVQDPDDLSFFGITNSKLRIRESMPDRHLGTRDDLLCFEMGSSELRSREYKLIRNKDRDIQDLYKSLSESLKQSNFIEIWHKNLIDLNIVIRMNDVLILRKVLRSNIFHVSEHEYCKKLLEFTLVLGNGSRLVIAEYLWDIMMGHIKPSGMINNDIYKFRKDLETFFIRLFCQNDYKLYKSAVNVINDEDYRTECRILFLMFRENPILEEDPNRLQLYKAMQETEFITFKRELIFKDHNDLVECIFNLFVKNLNNIEAKMKILEICLNFIVEFKQIKNHKYVFCITKVLWCWQYFSEAEYFSDGSNNKRLVNNMSPSDLLKEFKKCYKMILDDDKRGKEKVEDRLNNNYKIMWKIFNTKMETVT